MAKPSKAKQQKIDLQRIEDTIEATLVQYKTRNRMPLSYESFLFHHSDYSKTHDEVRKEYAMLLIDALINR